MIRESIFLRRLESGVLFFRDPGNMNLVTSDLRTNDFYGNNSSLASL